MHSSDTAYLWNHCKWNCKWRCGSLVSFILSKEHVAHAAKVQQKNRCSVLHTCSSSRIAAVADSRGCTSNCLSNVVSGRIASKFMHCRVQYHSTVHYNTMQVDQLCVTGGGEAAVAAAAGQRHQLAPHSVHTSWLRKPVHHQHQQQNNSFARISSPPPSTVTQKKKSKKVPQHLLRLAPVPAAQSTAGGSLGEQEKT